MEVQINGESKQVREEVTISQLLDELGLRARRVAIEVNRELVPRGRHETTQLSPGDKIEIVTLVGGG